MHLALLFIHLLLTFCTKYTLSGCVYGFFLQSLLCHVYFGCALVLCGHSTRSSKTFVSSPATDNLQYFWQLDICNVFFSLFFSPLMIIHCKLQPVYSYAMICNLQEIGTAKEDAFRRDLTINRLFLCKLIFNSVVLCFHCTMFI